MEPDFAIGAGVRTGGPRYKGPIQRNLEARTPGPSADLSIPATRSSKVIERRAVLTEERTLLARLLQGPVAAGTSCSRMFCAEEDEVRGN